MQGLRDLLRQRLGGPSLDISEVDESVRLLREELVRRLLQRRLLELVLLHVECCLLVVVTGLLLHASLRAFVKGAERVATAVAQWLQ